MKRRTGATAPNEPSTDAEWQEAVDAAYAAALIDAAVSLGLLEAGPRVEMGRCRQLLRRGKGLGFTPRKDEVVRIIASLVSGQHPGYARRFAERLYERHRVSESGGIWIDV